MRSRDWIISPYAYRPLGSAPEVIVEPQIKLLKYYWEAEKSSFLNDRVIKALPPPPLEFNGRRN